MSARLHALVSALVVLAACDIPHDPDNTLRRVTNGIIRVGYSANSPWVTDAGSAPGGIEATLASAIARSVNARIAWIKRPEADLLKSLHERQLDLVISGLTQESAWRGHAAFTRSYYTDSVVIAVDENIAAPASVRNAQILVGPGDPVAAVIRRKGGAAIPETGSPVTRLPHAMHTWAIRPPMKNTRVVLLEGKHVIAVAPGENAWLVHIEKLLEQNKRSVPSMLRNYR